MTAFSPAFMPPAPCIGSQRIWMTPFADTLMKIVVSKLVVTGG